MPRLTKIYTGQGDAGKTRLSSGQLVNKHDLRVTSYGAVDELNSHIGLALTMNISDQLAPILSSIQNELFHLGSDLSFAAEESEQRNIPQIEARHIARLEEVIDELNAQKIWDNPIVTEVSPLHKFYMAEDYHQEYFARNPYQPYCQAVVAP
ncbi:MAG: peptide-methionine (S)-S-oxide reductase, partial [Candidatus Promineifilaceae bacterium]